MTRALKKLIDYKNAVGMAFSLLNDELEEECELTFLLKAMTNTTAKIVRMESKMFPILHAKQTISQIREI